MMNKEFKMISLLLFFFISNFLSAQITVTDAINGLYAQGIDSSDISEELENIYKEILQNPETLNFILHETFMNTEKDYFLKDLNLQFETLHSDNNSALGLSYSYGRGIKTAYFKNKSPDKSGIRLSFSSCGNISFNKKIVPDDFLHGKFNLLYFNNSGGVLDISEQLSDSLTSIEMRLAEFEDLEELNRSGLWKDYAKTVVQNLSTQLYYAVGFCSGLEVSQDFSRGQFTIGMHAGIDIKVWNNENFLSQMNLFDLPFALFRWLSGTDRDIEVQGSVYPTFLFKMDYVNSIKNDTRLSAGIPKEYFRFGCEGAFKTLLAKIKGNPLYIIVNYFHYSEIKPDKISVQNSRNNSNCWIISLVREDGLYIRYSTGRQPPDLIDDNIYSLGFKYEF